MFHIFLLTSKRFLSLAVQSFVIPAQAEPQSDGERPISSRWRRRLVMTAFLPFLALVIIIHWVGFLLDEIFYRGYRQIPVREPLFVLGIPRSGTTNLHRVLAQDPQFTTFSTWESLFALSVSARRFWIGLARLDHRLGGQGARLFGWIEQRVFAAIDDVHPMTLSAPEEDYFALLPILACFILVLPFPFAQRFWDIGQFDRRIPPDEQRRILAFYRRCLQKHLYVHGSDKRLLSKNAAFAPLAGSLRDTFPDARFLVCLREPAKTLPSQLSSIESGLRFFGAPAHSPWIRDHFLEQLRFYYLNLSAAFRDLPPQRCAWLGMHALREDLGTALDTIYHQLSLPLSDPFRVILEQEAAANRRYCSRHSYRLAQFGLDEAALDQHFATVYADPLLATVLTPDARQQGRLPC